jgi:hypothetical protein
MKPMKRLSILLACSAAMLCGAEFAGVHAVYVMPMARGVDQFLVNRLTGSGLFQVVADPKLADAIFTDRIDDAFRASLEEISPTPKPPADEKEKDDKKAKSEDKPAAPDSAFGRGKGTFFLVNAKSRGVVWSTFEPSADSSAKELDRTAADIVSRLRKDMGQK